jgi:hypothetical protein
VTSYNRKGIPSGECNPVLPRLNAKTTKTASGCWLFDGPRSNKYGHTKIGFNRKFITIARVSWMIHRGPIPPGMHVLHKCIGTPMCWNPDHLYLGTNKDNARDRMVQGRKGDVTGAKNGRAKLTGREVAEIRGPTAGFLYSQIAEMYGVSVSAISDIRRGVAWANQ